LARAQLSGLVDFQQTCRNVPPTISLGGSNSVLEWVVLPQMGKLRELLGNVRFELYSGRTNEHAKNFSVFLLPSGAYRLTPRYDILSAYPVLGHGRGSWRRRK
jgi:hypothetical protein